MSTTEDHNNPRRSAIALWGPVILGVASVIAVFALPEKARQDYPDRIPVRFWHMWTGNWKVEVEQIVDQFNESQDRYEVIPLSIPGSAADTKFLLSVDQLSNPTVPVAILKKVWLPWAHGRRYRPVIRPSLTCSMTTPGLGNRTNLGKCSSCEA